MNLKSKYFTSYYGINPAYYDLAYIHYNMDFIANNQDEYIKLKNDLKTVKEYTGNLFKLYFSTIDDLILFCKYKDLIKEYSSYIYLRINSNDDIDKLNNLAGIDNIKIIVSYSKLNDYKIEKINKYNLVIQVDLVKELSINELNNIKDKYNINYIMVGQICYLDDSFIRFFQRIADKYKLNFNNQLEVEKQAIISNDIYSIKEYIDIYNKLLELVSNVNINDNEVKKFKTIYDTIIYKIEYDFNGVKETKLENQNLIGGLFKNTSVCEGYSKILQQALSLVNIESIVVGGGGLKEEDGHIWNQVKIDNDWYNVDVTYDSIQVHNNKPIKVCLVSDDEYYYKTKYLIAKKCDKHL